MLDASLHRVDTGKIERLDGNVIRAALKPKLLDGGYVVAWRVVSADAHPISGGFTFRVGAASTAVDPSVVQDLLAGQIASVWGSMGSLTQHPQKMKVIAVANPQRMTQFPDASAAATPPHGMAIGKFHGDTTTVTPFASARAPDSSWKALAELR